MSQYLIKWMSRRELSSAEYIFPADLKLDEQNSIPLLYDAPFLMLHSL